MLEGTTVLWPDGEPYYTLMRQRIDDGPTAFASEKQNEPLDPALCDFPEAWFAWFTEVERAGEWVLVPEDGDAIRLADCDVFAAVDPSMGRLDRNGDPSALVSVAAYPSQRLPAHTGRYQTFWVVDADIRRRHPHVITEDLLTMHRLRRFERVGVEAIQFQELFAEDIQAQADADPLIRDFHVVKLKPHSDKKLRIQKLGPLIHARRLRFARKLTTLYDQLRYFPHHAHDDGPDALELCLEVLGEIGWVMLDVAPPEAPTMQSAHAPLRSLREAANSQIKEQFAKHFARDDCGTCGECLYLGAGGRCTLRELLVEPGDPGGDAFDLREEGLQP